jgi:hypothetical protein
MMISSNPVSGGQGLSVAPLKATAWTRGRIDLHGGEFAGRLTEG